jgi:hypothetical protein
MRKRTQKKPEPTVDQLNSEAQRTTLETQATAMADAARTAITVQPDIRVEAVKKSNGQGERVAIRAANGKFTKLATAVAAKDARQGQEFLLEKIKNEAGLELTRKQHLRNALYEGAIAAAKEPRALGNSVKSFQALNEDAALTQAKENMLQSANQEVTNPIRVVVINCPENMLHKEIVNLDEKKPEERKTPSFIDAEFKTNPRQE